MQMLTMAAAQNVALSSTTPKLVNGASAAAGTNQLSNCSIVRSLFESQGINGADIPQQPITDAHLVYCDNTASGSCCTKSMELKLAGASRNQLERNTKDLIGKLASVLSARATRFNEFFKTLLSQSKSEFHEMFKRTYGVIYEQNSYVFSDLFNELENYYIRGKVDLAEALDTFFNILYQKMFTVLNSQYKFDDKYLGCVSENMKQLKPFGDVPEKLTGQIKRSFVATRTFEQALSSAAEVARNMANIRPGADCTSALTKMQQCGACRGYAEKPCSNYCVNVMRGCLSHYIELDIEWDNFVQSMDKIIERLLGPFNIVMVVEPINIKISEAIMNFQETGQDISAQIFNGCGKPQLNPRQRRRRSVSPRLLLADKRYFDDISNKNSDDLSADSFSFIDEEMHSNGASLSDYEGDSSMQKMVRSRRQVPAQTERANNRDIIYEPFQFDGEPDEDISSPSNKNNRRKNKNNNRNGGGGGSGNAGSRGRNDDDMDDNKEAPLDKLVKDIRTKIKDSKKFWSNLPYQICNNEDVAASPSNDMNCWNGNRIDRYPHMIANDQSSNPEFLSQQSGRRPAMFDAQLFTIKNAVIQLRNAFNGHDVEWADVEEPYYGSGSGSGGGSIEDNEEGSGLGAIDYTPSINEAGSSTTHSTDATGDVNQHGGDVESPTNKSDKDTKTRIDDSESNNINKIDSNSSSNNNKNSDSGAVGTKPQMSLKRALFTYFLPIYLAWFGGLFSELL